MRNIQPTWPAVAFTSSGNQSARACRALSTLAGQLSMSSHPSLGVQLLRTVTTRHHTLCGGHRSFCPESDSIPTWPQCCSPCQASDWVETSVQDVRNPRSLQQQHITKRKVMPSVARKEVYHLEA
ncbi:hypothetical protein mRhiFer1_007834 [Rhinolophus ferrumequinum]|uniref:Uncharacterized protein n=1 Tax=Rhinolophus ferrumequinum TaxID=59479 RepID=A0A7J8AV19_RHIFE|nr:hypothetical protein mRhiFer1_007834 [Rhinolophus ferrumequinum]